MKPKWIKVGDTQKDLFEILDLVKKGVSIKEMTKIDKSVSIEEIQKLLSRTKVYLQSHLILDKYLETVNKLPQVAFTEFELEWTANEIRELVALHISGASIKNIAVLMRKNKIDIKEKLQSLNLV